MGLAQIKVWQQWKVLKHCTLHGHSKRHATSRFRFSFHSFVLIRTWNRRRLRLGISRLARFSFRLTRYRLLHSRILQRTLHLCAHAWQASFQHKFAVCISHFVHLHNFAPVPPLYVTCHCTSAFHIARLLYIPVLPSEKVRHDRCLSIYLLSQLAMCLKENQ